MTSAAQVEAVAGRAARGWMPDFILLGAIWGASFLFMRIGAVEFGAVPTAAVRVAIAAAFLWPLLLLRGLGPQLRQHWKPVFAIGLLNSGIPFALYSFALLSITTGLSSVLNATLPLFGALIARLIEQAGTQRALAVTFLVPVFAVLYGVLFLGESVTGWMLLCAGVIVCGTSLSTGLLVLPGLKRRG